MPHIALPLLLRIVLLIIFSSSLYTPLVNAQVKQGMVWNPPAHQARAMAELEEMKQSGVQVIRTPFLRNEALYEAADSLGLQLYQDLPFTYLSAPELLDTLDYAKVLVREAITLANKHISIRHWGLGKHHDTSDPSACQFFDEVAKEARRHALQTLTFYYITTFIEDEQCTGSLDVVMMDVLDEKNPVALLERWHKAHPESKVGIDALGTWIEEREGEQDGHQLKNSPAYQARYLENNLNALLNEERADNFQSVFVYRWRDIRLEYPSISHNLNHPYRHTYGLKTNRGTNRASYDVVRGIYTGEQRVFAFPVGKADNPGASWIVLLGWITITLLGIGFANFSRFGPNAKRYFAAHGFYREAVREGRELIFGPTALLLLVVMISFGIAGTVILDTVRVSEAFSALVRWLPTTPRSTIVALLSNQLVMILIIGSGFAVGVTIWTSVLSAITARNRRRLLPGQTFMLVVWPQWPVIIAMVAAIVISTLEKTNAATWSLALFFILVIASLAAAVRAFRDYAAITKPNLLQATVAFFGNPFLFMFFVGIYLCIKHIEKFSFFWHLVTRN